MTRLPILPALLVAFSLVAQDAPKADAAKAAATKLTLQDAIETSLKNNLQVQIAKEARTSTQAGVWIEEFEPVQVATEDAKMVTAQQIGTAATIRPRAGTAFFDYENKYAANGAEEICPAPVDEALTLEIQRMSLDAHKVLGIVGYSRSDFMVDEKGQPHILETNTLPGMTPTSLLPKAAAAVGLSFDALVAELVRLGLAAHDRRSGPGASA